MAFFNVYLCSPRGADYIQDRWLLNYTRTDHLPNTESYRWFSPIVTLLEMLDSVANVNTQDWSRTFHLVVTLVSNCYLTFTWHTLRKELHNLFEDSAAAFIITHEFLGRICPIVTQMHSVIQHSVTIVRNSVAFSPQANSTDRATAACRRS
jgi:hypothetical protein